MSAAVCRSSAPVAGRKVGPMSYLEMIHAVMIILWLIIYGKGAFGKVCRCDSDPFKEYF